MDNQDHLHGKDWNDQGIKLVPADFKIDPDELNRMVDLMYDRNRIVRQFAEDAVRTRERMYWKMIAAGQLPSQGWKIGERTEIDGTRMAHHCWPVPPAKRAK